MTKPSSYPNFFNFLVKKEKAKEPFSAQEAANFLSIKKGTIQKYINEKIKSYVFTEKDSTGSIIYYARGISLLSLEDFNKIMTQGYKAKELTDIEILYTKLVEKSFDAFAIALEIYNRPTLKNKVEVFAILIINAWETLLKAKLIKDANNKEAIYRKGQIVNGEKYTVSITEALDKIYNDPSIIKENLSAIIGMRDKATHFLIEQLRPILSQLFQASIINYIEEYEKNFGKIPLINNSPGMLTLVIPGENDISEVKKIYGDKTYNEVESFLKKLKLTEAELNSDNFMCKISYVVYLDKKKAERANVSLLKGDNGSGTTIINHIINPLDNYKLKFTDVVRKINKSYDRFNSATMTAFIKRHSIKGNKDYHYVFEKVERYSDKLVNFINQEILNDHKFFENIKVKK